MMVMERSTSHQSMPRAHTRTSSASSTKATPVPRTASSSSLLTHTHRNRSRVSLHPDTDKRRRSHDGNQALAAAPPSKRQILDAAGLGFTVAHTAPPLKDRKQQRKAKAREMEHQIPDDSWISETDTANNSPGPSPGPDDRSPSSTHATTAATTSTETSEDTLPRILSSTPTQSLNTSHGNQTAPPSLSAPVSPTPHDPHRSVHRSRKSSASSTLAPSIRSLAVFARAPTTPALRRSATALHPKLDLDTLGWGESVASGGDSPSERPATQMRHQRTVSTTSTNTTTQSDLARRLREASIGPSPNGNHMGKRVSSTSALKEQPSGYFDSLRNLASVSSASLSQIIHPEASPVQEHPIANAPKKISPSGLPYPNARKNSAGPSQASAGKTHSPLISKFISPSSHERIYRPPHTSSSDESVPQTANSNGSVHGAGYSRTQQKLMMQKHAPLPSPSAAPHLHPGSSEPCTIHHAPLIPPPLQPSAASSNVNGAVLEWHLNEPAERAQHLQTLKMWAMAVVKEADRVDREHDFVKRYRDPIAESFARLKDKQRSKPGRAAKAR